MFTMPNMLTRKTAILKIILTYKLSISYSYKLVLSYKRKLCIIITIVLPHITTDTVYTQVK